MDVNPFFSIILPTYNRASHIKGAIDSIIRQKYTNWECIVVDDGSTDQTFQIVNDFKDNRIRYYYKINEERSIARNYGIDRAKGRYICFLDSDDIFYSNHLPYLKEEIEKYDFPIAFFHTGAIEFRDNREIERPQYNEYYKHPFYFLLKRNIMINAACIHRDIFLKMKFPEKFFHWEDTHLWLRIVLKYPFIQLGARTTQRNFHEGTSVNDLNTYNFRRFKNYLECLDDFHSSDIQISRYWSKKDFMRFKKDLVIQNLKRQLDQNMIKKIFLFYYLGCKFCDFSFQINFFFQLKHKTGKLLAYKKEA